MSAKDQMVPERKAFEEWQDGKAVYQMTAWDIWLAATAAEREACATVAEEFEDDMGDGKAQKIADAIRMRSNGQGQRGDDGLIVGDSAAPDGSAAPEPSSGD